MAYTWLASDDGKSALVEFVARDHAAFVPLLSARRTDVKAFEKGKAKKADIEAEFRKHRKSFKLETLEVLVP